MRAVGGVAAPAAPLARRGRGSSVDRRSVGRVGRSRGSPILGPLWDHTVCAIANNLRGGERLAQPHFGRILAPTAEMHYRYFLGSSGRTPSSVGPNLVSTAVAAPGSVFTCRRHLSPRWMSRTRPKRTAPQAVRCCMTDYWSTLDLEARGFGQTRHKVADVCGSSFVGRFAFSFDRGIVCEAHHLRSRVDDQLTQPQRGAGSQCWT